MAKPIVYEEEGRVENVEAGEGHDVHQNLLSSHVVRLRKGKVHLLPVLLRTIGLNILNAAGSKSWKSKRQNNDPNPRSRREALVRVIIHVFPFLGAATLITLNVFGVYIGVDMVWLPILQFVAKAHEMSMQASIAAVVFNYVCYQLTHRHLPFGGIFAGLQVAQLSYLWSTEFWGTVSSQWFSGTRRFLFVLFISLSILLAASVGPSSAIALIPRQTQFSAGSTLLWLNATYIDIYPSTLNSSNVPDGCESSPNYSILGNDCPYSEWLAIATMLNNYPGYTGSRWNTLQNEDTTRQLYLDVTADQKVNSVFVTTQQAAIAEAFQNVVDTWTSSIASYPGSGGNPSRFHLHYNYFHLLETTQPYVAARCLENNFTAPINISANVTFPNRRTPWTLDDGYWTSSDLPIEPLITSIPQASDSYHITWLDLPRDFSNASLGAIVTTPQNSTSPDSTLYACTLYTSWGPATINSTQDPSDIILSTNPPDPWEIFPSWPVQWVNISSSWAEFLTPSISNQNTGVDSALYTLLGEELDPDVIDPDHPAYIHEAVIASLVANGMARNAYWAAAFGQNDDSLPTNNSIVSWLLGRGHNLYDVDQAVAGHGYRLDITSSVEGLAYSMNDVAIKIAFAVLIVYCLYVMCHVAFTLVTGLSSSAWDTIAELMVLALNSVTPAGYEDMTAGIRGVRIFREEVGIRTVGGEGFQIVFGSPEIELIESVPV